MSSVTSKRPRSECSESGLTRRAQHSLPFIQTFGDDPRGELRYVRTPSAMDRILMWINTRERGERERELWFVLSQIKRHEAFPQFASEKKIDPNQFGTGLCEGRSGEFEVWDEWFWRTFQAEFTPITLSSCRIQYECYLAGLMLAQPALSTERTARDAAPTAGPRSVLREH